MKRTSVFSAMLLAGAVTLSGCNTTPVNNNNLEEARANYNAAQTDPQVVSLAAVEFKQAGDALTQAEVAWRNHDKPEEVNHLAYIAKQKVEIAKQIAAEKIAEKTVADADANRTKVLLDARTNEADQANVKANEANAKAKALAEELKAKNTDRGMTITLGDVLFDTGKSQLKSGAMRSLQKLAMFLQQYPDRKVSIEGFTDSRGGDDYNQTLSERRADAVRESLTGLGVSSDRIETHGFGKQYPVASNDDAAGQQMNRRVEIVVSNDNQAVKPRQE